MGNNDIKVKDLSTTSSISTDNKLMLLTDEANNTVQNITVENLLANIKSSNANNALTIGTDKKLYTPDISGEVGDLDNLITTNKTDIVSAINEVKGAVVPASKGYLENGQTYTDETLYNNVYAYNHSTNVTGIDTIKPADYTTVGSPTISADGIATSLNSSNYITLPNLTVGNNWELTYKVIWNTATRSNSSILLQMKDGTATFQILNQTSKAITSSIYGMFGSTKYINYISDSEVSQFTDDDVVLINLKANNNVLYYTVYKNGSVFKTNHIDSITNNIGTLTEFAIGEYSNSATTMPIDLNSFKIYVNGNLIYQPCLLIPYTESKTGSKVVDVAYRDRVIDVYEQYGSANYYTIDETNKNATLPMGEIYGFIRQADSDKIYKDLVPCYDSTKAIIVPLLGNYTAPADGYVCSPNMVLVLDPDNGYENFSLTIMRNTQSMTMISCTGPTAFPFCLPVLKDDVLTLAADATVTSNVYFIPREGV